LWKRASGSKQSSTSPHSYISLLLPELVIETRSRIYNGEYSIASLPPAQTNTLHQPIDNEGSPTNWTLRFKHGRLTILLFTEALTPLSTLKTELLDALRERYPSGLPNPAHGAKIQLGLDEYIPIPDDIKDVALAVPVDNHDISKGWKALDGTSGKDAIGLKASPKSVGVKDGGVLAFRFRGEDEGGEDEEEEEGGEEEEEEEEGDAEKQEFLVEWPSYDETYGEAEPDGEDMEMDEK
jgi:ribosomal protein L12E/L44/L45/RPP1/RPP2